MGKVCKNTESAKILWVDMDFFCRKVIPENFCKHAYYYYQVVVKRLLGKARKVAYTQKVRKCQKVEEYCKGNRDEKRFLVEKRVPF